MIIGYTTGVFDLFHKGHLNLFRESKKYCDKLIVGVTTDELSISFKGKRPIVPFEERCEILKAIKYVDEVVPQTSMDKFKAWENLNFDVMFVNDDPTQKSREWSKIEREFREKFEGKNMKSPEIIYIPYLSGVSSSLRRQVLKGEKENKSFLVPSAQKNLSQCEEKIISIINKAIEFDNPKNILKNKIKRLSNKSFMIENKVIDLSEGNLYILGWGKASVAMAEGIEEILGDMIHEGIVISNQAKSNLKKIRLLMGCHPFPSEENISSTKRLANLAIKCKEKDYVICLISGGGSALLCLPPPEISLDDKMETTKIMTLAGIAGEEINIVRKHISDIKGGKLSRLIYPATVFNLILSDDVNNNMNSIASGATVQDTSTFSDALKIIAKYNLENKIPPTVLSYLKANIKTNDKETLKQDDISFYKTTNIIIYENRTFLETLKNIAEKEGFERVEIYPQILKKDINEELTKFYSFVEEINRYDENILVLAGGEMGVRNINGGLGGRAQHFAALMIPYLSRLDNSVFAAFATDGEDFIEGIAGALINSKTMNLIKDRKIDYENYISNTDTFNLHRNLKTHLFTRVPTQTNIFDVYIFGREKLNIPEKILANYKN